MINNLHFILQSSLKCFLKYFSLFCYNICCTISSWLDVIFNNLIEFVNLSKQQTFLEFLARFVNNVHIFYQHHKHPSLLFLFQDRKIGFDTLLLWVFFWDLKLDARSSSWSQMFDIEYSLNPNTTNPTVYKGRVQLENLVKSLEWTRPQRGGRTQTWS